MNIKIGDRARVRTGPWKGRIGVVYSLRAPFGDDGSELEPDAATVGFLIGDNEHRIEFLIGNLLPAKKQ